jgi:hypothetical protein
MHPFMKAGHKNDPKWLSGLNKYKEKAEAADTARVIKNYDADGPVTREASYLPRGKKSK